MVVHLSHSIVLDQYTEYHLPHLNYSNRIKTAKAQVWNYTDETVLVERSTLK